jgi:hypothetical protein
VVYLTGSLSLASAGTVREVLRKTLAERGRVVADVSGLRLEWPPTVELFPTVLRGAGGWPVARLVLSGARGDLERALRLARVPRSVPCESRLEAAVARLHERPERVVRTRELPCALSSACRPGVGRGLLHGVGRARADRERSAGRLRAGVQRGGARPEQLPGHDRPRRAQPAGLGARLRCAVPAAGGTGRARRAARPRPAGGGGHLLGLGILVHGDGKTVWATVAPDKTQGASSTQS